MNKKISLIGAGQIGGTLAHLIGTKELDAMKPDSVIINVSRGLVIQENALFKALKENKIGGAVIDVWYNHVSPEKPDIWPSNLPFQDLDNIIVTAHESAAAREQVQRRWQFVASNIKRVIDGDAPMNFVFEGTQQST